MTRLRPEPRHLPLALALFAVAAHAQQGEGGAASSSPIKPRLGFSQTVTDNLRLNDREKDAALITTVSPGVSVTLNSGTVRGTLDYALNGITYVKTSYGTRVQNALTANGQVELIPGSLFVDAQANIGQQNVSAFGLQSPATLGSQGAVSTLNNPNSRETGNLTVSPLWRTRLGGLATVDLRGNFSMAETRGSALGDSHGSGGSLRIDQLGGGQLTWYVQAITQQLRPKATVSNRNSSAVVGLNYQPDPDWTFSANAGTERNDYLSRQGNADNGTTAGVTAQWTPTPRTRLGGDYQRHSYGNSHGLTFEHRMRNSVWRLSDTRSLMLGNSGATGGVRTNYDLYFLLFASLEPDVVKRDALVRSALQSLGLTPDAPAAVGFLSAGPSRLRNQVFSFTLQGVRSNITASVNRSVTTRLAAGLNQGDLASNALIEQRSYSLSGSYQLSPVSGLSLTVSRQESSGDSAAQKAQLSSLFANWTVRLGGRLNAQLGARHSRFEGTTPYTENAAYANITQQF